MYTLARELLFSLSPETSHELSIDLIGAGGRLGLAPTGVVIRARNGNRTVARINRPVVNGEVSEADRALLVIPSPDPKEWAIDVRPWRKAE